jgi:hypothetical protein
LNNFIIAAGPYVGGPGTEPHRVVLVRWLDGKFSVHSQRHDDKSLSDGSYFGADWLTATECWHTRLSVQLDNYATHVRPDLPKETDNG